MEYNHPLINFHQQERNVCTQAIHTSLLIELEQWSHERAECPMAQSIEKNQVPHSNQQAVGQVKDQRFIDGPFTADDIILIRGY